MVGILSFLIMLVVFPILTNGWNRNPTDDPKVKATMRQFWDSKQNLINMARRDCERLVEEYGGSYDEKTLIYTSPDGQVIDLGEPFRIGGEVKNFFGDERP